MIKFPFTIIIALIYVAGSFMFDIWHPLWIIFLTIPIYYRFALACKANNKKVFNLLIPVPEIIPTVFFILGFTVGQWKYIWILFLLIPIYYWMIIAFTKAE